MKYKRTCIDCNKEFITNVEAYYKCSSCRHNTVYEVKNIDEYLEVYNNKRPCKVSYVCEKCGCLYTKGIIKSTPFKGHLYCLKCDLSETNTEVSRLHKNELLDKRNKTIIENYGSYENFIQRRTSSYEKNNIRKYGVKNTAQLKSVQDKMKSTCLERYGSENIFSSEIGKAKIKQSLQSRYGVDNPRHMDNYYEKFHKTCLDKYGVEWFQQTHGFRAKCKKKYLYHSIYFDSSWELYLYIYAMENNIPIEKEPCSFEYEYDNNTYKYFPDYRYDGKLIELKGDHFFNEDGTMCNPYDHSQDGKYEAKHQCGLKNGVQFWKDSDIKFAIDYVDGKYTSDFIPLFRVDLPFPYLNQALLDTSDMGLIHHFHKSIYEATRKGKLSPLQAWMDKDIIEKVAVNRLKYVGRCRPSDILQGFNVTRIANKVSLFKPSLAERLIDSYLGDYSHIVDPFSGFSGRMLGAISSGKAYTGFDINESHVRESNEILKFKNADNVSVSIKDLLKTETTIMENTALFTCPPYGGKEHWNENNDEVEHTCDEWITMCLDKYKVDRYLFVVDRTDIYKDHIVQELTNKSHFGGSKEYVILI